MFHLVSWVCFISLTFMRMAIYGGVFMVAGTGPVREVGGRGGGVGDIFDYVYAQVGQVGSNHSYQASL